MTAKYETAEVLQLRESYRTHWCHVCQVGLCVVNRYCAGVGHHLHHIWPRGPKAESWTNYVMACHSCHDWAHARPTVARIACMAYKQRFADINSELPDAAMHWSVKALDEAAGKSVAGWCEMVYDQSQRGVTVLPDWCHDELLGLMEALGCNR